MSLAVQFERQLGLNLVSNMDANCLNRIKKQGGTFGVRKSVVILNPLRSKHLCFYIPEIAAFGTLFDYVWNYSLLIFPLPANKTHGFFHALREGRGSFLFFTEGVRIIRFLGGQGELQQQKEEFNE